MNSTGIPMKTVVVAWQNESGSSYARPMTPGAAFKLQNDLIN